MSQFHFTPERYLALMREAIPVFDEFEQAVADATVGVHAATILDLGTGTGETARRLLHVHPTARLTGFDTSDGMLAIARAILPGDQVDRLVLGDLDGPLPTGPFDLIVAALSVHHLTSERKSALFARVAAALKQGGRFVLGDVVVPEHHTDAVTPIAPEHDHPESLGTLAQLLVHADLTATVVWTWRDLAVIVADHVSSEPFRV